MFVFPFVGCFGWKKREAPGLLAAGTGRVLEKRTFSFLFFDQFILALRKHREHIIQEADRLCECLLDLTNVDSLRWCRCETLRCPPLNKLVLAGHRVGQSVSEVLLAA